MNQRKRRPGPDSPGILPFIIDPVPLAGASSFAGLPLVAEAFRALQLDEAVARLVGVKQRAKGPSDAQFVEAFLLMLAAGGECILDLKVLREDPAMSGLLGYVPPSPDAGRHFLYAFHDEAIMAGRPVTPNTAWVPAESRPLFGLAEVNRLLVERLAGLLPPAVVRVATLDHDASVISSRNREALPVYSGGRGYQPVFVLWDELDVVVADEFRDGNVPAGAFNLPLVRRAFEALPATVTERYFRADSACYDHAVLSYLRNEKISLRSGFAIGFAISADMSQALRKAIAALPEKAWRPLDAGREWAQVFYVPEAALAVPDDVPVDRYIAIRKKPVQLTLWEQDGYSYWAVVTNLDWSAKKILEWHRGKAGSIEHFHLVAKQELGLGVMPCGRFGADAAWTRLNVLAFNVLEVLKRTALPPRLKRARPKRLRFEVIRLAGVIVRHARCVVVKLACSAARIAELIEARFQLAGLALVASG